ncbi:MAG: hypothetical protein RLZZ524_2186, partial [Pseudomonadota bacterium]
MNTSEFTNRVAHACAAEQTPGCAVAHPSRARRWPVLLHLLDAARHPRPGSGLPGPQRVATHFLRCARHLDTFRRWYGDDGNPALQRELAARPYLVTCVVHPYLHGDWAPERRLDIIRTHYSLMHGACALLHASGPAWLAGTAEGLHLRLDRPGKF